MDEDELRSRYLALVPAAERLMQVLKQVLELQNNERIAHLSAETEQQLSFVRDRAFATAALTLAKLEAVDPTLLSEPGLQVLHNNWQNVFNELNAFGTNGNNAHLTNARSYLDNGVPSALWGFFQVIGADPEADHYVAAINAISDASSSRLRALNDQAERALAELQTQSDAVVSEIAGAKAEIGTLSARIEQQGQENDAAIAKMEKEFAAAEQSRLERFSLAAASQREDYAARAGLKEYDAEALLGRLQEQEQRVLELVQAIGTRGITANYSVIAEEELVSADRWRVATMCIFGIGIVAAIVIFVLFLLQGGDKLNLQVIALRLGFAIAITAPAIYTARESARHRTTGDRARQSEMELASLGPFIANLERDSQDSIRRGLVSKYFGQKIDAHSAEPPVKFKDVSELAVELVKATREGSEKKK